MCSLNTLALLPFLKCSCPVAPHFTPKEDALFLPAYISYRLVVCQCLKCAGAEVHDIVHLFCSCVAVSNAWSWVQRQVVKWGQIGAGVDDWEILNLIYADSCHGTEIVWLVSSYVLYVWETVQVMKLEVKLDKFFGFLNFKYKMHQTTSKYQLQNLHYT